MVRNAYQGLGGEYETLLGAFDKENEVFKKRVGKDRVRATYMARVRARNHVAAFIRSHYKRNDISMPELTPDFIKEFAVFLSNEAGLHNGSNMGKLHVAERCGDAGAFQRTYTEKSVCPVPYKPEHKRA